MKKIVILNGAGKKNGNTATPVYWFTISGQLKMAVDRLYAIQRNHGFNVAKKETVFLMTSGAPAERNPQPITWYQTFEQMGWKSHGMALNDVEEARRIGESIR